MVDNIFVTKPFLPPLEEFEPYLKEIWDKAILTNSGPFHTQLEDELAEYLEVPYVSLVNNGTMALVIALSALAVTGEVITTPFSFIATCHAILWNHLVPVFVDIEAGFLNLDPNKVEAAITPNTTAILAVHCFGNPAHLEFLEDIAKRHNLKLIFDASHAFGVQRNHKSILNFGDLSTLSFHATKVFNTFEGGAIISQNKEMKDRIDQIKNFGIISETEVSVLGINGKMSEINSAFGLLQLKHIDKAIRKRGDIARAYIEAINLIEGLDYVGASQGVTQENYSYFPILVRPSYPISRDDLCWKMKEAGVHARRYFFPLLTDFVMYKHFPSANSKLMPIASKSADQVICLPIYPELGSLDVERIVELIKLP
jgi:dTDP-4-amino-4,6-dideoxygalactose transaminase